MSWQSYEFTCRYCGATYAGGGELTSNELAWAKARVCWLCWKSRCDNCRLTMHEHAQLSDGTRKCLYDATFYLPITVEGVNGVQ